MYSILIKKNCYTNNEEVIEEFLIQNKPNIEILIQMILRLSEMEDCINLLKGDE